jgi:ferredoxin-NADP reductase
MPVVSPPVIRQFKVAANRGLADGIFELELAPNDGQPVFGYRPGQFVMLQLLNPDGSVWAKAAYSLAGSPEESRDSVFLAIKIRGEFSQRASRLVPGDVLNLQGPFGRFVPPENDAHLVLLAGGIGITPFRSILRHLLVAEPNRPVTLIYSCRTLQVMPYFDELREAVQQHPKFNCVITFTGYAPDGWEGETGRVGQKLIAKHVPDAATAEFMACGTNDFVKDMQDSLAKLGVDVTLRLHKEIF